MGEEPQRAAAGSSGAVTKPHISPLCGSEMKASFLCAMVRSAGEGETVCRTYIWLGREHWCYFKMQIVGEMRLIMT